MIQELTLGRVQCFKKQVELDIGNMGNLHVGTIFLLNACFLCFL